jgi:hypothetical protein
MLKRTAGLVVALGLVGLTALSACSGKEKAPVAHGFCSRIDSVERATVTRVNTTADKYVPFGFPARLQITVPARARALATAICGLPRFPRNRVFHCPIDLGIRYQVRFFGDIGLVKIDPGGCETVTGAGPVRWASRTPRFWQGFGRALGFEQATRATFAGRLR